MVLQNSWLADMHILKEMAIQTTPVGLTQSEVQRPWMTMTQTPSGV